MTSSVLLVFLGVVYFLVCIFIVLIVMIQPSKSGGGLGGLGGGATGGAISESLGATQAEKQLATWTYWATGVFFALALSLTALGNLATGAKVDLIDKELPATTTVVPVSAPATPTSAS